MIKDDMTQEPLRRDIFLSYLIDLRLIRLFSTFRPVCLCTKVLVDGICVIQGMVKNGAKGTVVAVLPAECRPRERLTFNMNLKQSVARVDLLTSGSIRFQAAGTWTTSWLSLSGIHFPI